MHQSHWKGTGHRKNAARAYNYREFISYDGEGTTVREPVEIEFGTEFHTEKFYYWPDEDRPGMFKDHVRQPQPYVLLANSKGDRITRESGLGTKECFEYLLECGQKYPEAIHCGFYLGYDINQILKDLPEKKLESLHQKNKTTWNKYSIKWLPRKTFFIKCHRTGRKFYIYDTAGYFQASLLEVLYKYLGKDDSRIEWIRKGKEARDSFDWSQLDDFIIPYNDMEMILHVEVMNRLRDDLHSVGIDCGRWYGPGALANQIFTNERIPIDRERRSPEEILDAAQYAYFGGRFEHFRMGRYLDTVYEYDINSAYPTAIALLPNLQRGTWEHVTSFEPGSFGVWYCSYSAPHESWDTYRPQPIPCRAEDGRVTYPREVTGWYWTPEASLVPDYIQEGWIFREEDHSDRPFAFVEKMYEQRQVLKRAKSSAELAVKLALNCLYGKMAQVIGSEDETKQPRWHCLEYAGFVTSYTRAMIYNAILLAPDKIIAVETDAIFSAVPLDLPCSKELGDWELTTFDWIIYLQSGFYYYPEDGVVKAKYRGMDKDRNTGLPTDLPLEKVLRTLEIEKRSVRAMTNRFVGMGLALMRKETVWRTWEPKPKVTALYQWPWQANRKRNHIREECFKCGQGKSMLNELHPLTIGGYSGKSYARALPWRTVGGPESPILEWDKYVNRYGEMIIDWQD
jgi:DNA polymerase type B, organellar and viral